MSNNEVTLYWHDYETFGADPTKDRPAQFAGVRTDQNLNIIGEPLVQYCQPANDMLPHPQACLITGITPQTAQSRGVPEVTFIRRINQELAKPGTCALGYNSIRFDDEVTRHSLYRNFFDPYAREWQNGNSRWDIIDLARITCALRPDGIEWPKSNDGVPSFRLEDLTAANGIEHSGAHDALADVHATIAVAKLIKFRQPKLYAYVYQNRTKHRAASLLRVDSMEPVVHVSGRFSNRRYCLAVVAPLARHPVNKNSVLVYDLSVEPGPLLALSVDEIRQRVFTPTENLPADAGRIPLKNVHLNKCPVLAPVKTLGSKDAERLSIDTTVWQNNLAKLRQARDLPEKVSAVFTGQPFEKLVDPDLMLYSGGFFSDKDRMAMERIKKLPPAELADEHFSFDDPRLPEMLLRYRARNYPQTMSPQERARWEVQRRERVTIPGRGSSIVMEEYQQLMGQLRKDPGLSVANKKILDDLEEYGRFLLEDHTVLNGSDSL